MNLQDLFPNLNDDNHKITSPRTVDYNCTAWVAKNTQRWWQPGVFWPIDTSREDYGIGALVEVFTELGFVECSSSELEVGFEKVAIYGAEMLYTHMARQLEDGQWTSKLGQLEDITHTTPDVIAGGDYGEVVLYMKRIIDC